MIWRNYSSEGMDGPSRYLRAVEVAYMKGISKCSANTDPIHIKEREPGLNKDMFPLLRSQSVTVRGWHIEIAMKGEVAENLWSARSSRCFAQTYAFEKGWQRGSKRRENRSNSSAGSELGFSTQLFTAGKGRQCRVLESVALRGWTRKAVSC